MNKDDEENLIIAIATTIAITLLFTHIWIKVIRLIW
jgi:hypothetical protein